MKIGSGSSGAFLDQCWLSPPRGLTSLGYFKSERKRLRLQEQLVTKFPFVRGRKAPASAVQSPLSVSLTFHLGGSPILTHHCCHP